MHCEGARIKLGRFCFSRLGQRAAPGRTAVSKEVARTRIIEAVAFHRGTADGEDGVGAIFPPMANAATMYEALGRVPTYPPRATQRRAPPSSW